MKRKCTGSGGSPIVKYKHETAPRLGVWHICPICGRRWGYNSDNNGWRDIPIPLHLNKL